MGRDMTEDVEIEMIPNSLSAMGVRCDVGLDDDVWLRLSQFETQPDDSDLNKSGIFEVKEWLLKEKGLI